MPLSILLWLPLAFALAGALLGRRAAPRVALVGSVVALGLAVYYIADFQSGRPGLQHVTDETWIAVLGIHYKLGVDGLNLFLIALTTLLWVVATLYASFSNSSHPPERPQLFFVFMGMAETAVLGAFMAQDLALFVAFFDLMLVPFYFLIGMWGGRNRVGATTKLVIYTLVGSLLMLAGAIATGVESVGNTGHLTFVLSDLVRVGLPTGTQEWIFLLFAAAFLVKMPAFPVHGWLPDGYRAMPIPVVAVFSAVLSKVAAYGFLRIVLPLFPQATVHFQELLLLIALGSILYGSIMAFTQTDTRLIVGFSSIAQLGFITLGIFALNPQGTQGALLQMVNHGLVTAAVFFIIAVLAARASGSENVRDMGGIAVRAPVLAALFLIVALATLAMPGSSNFVGEFYILLGVFNAKLVIACVAFTGVVLASVYMLRAYIAAMHNRVGPKVESREISLRDGAVVAPLVLVIVAIAVYPQLLLTRQQATARAAVAQAGVLAGQIKVPRATAQAPVPAVNQPQGGQTP
ncbi:MAG: NuoM family protein [Solirubrobacteraceae bacterium]